MPFDLENFRGNENRQVTQPRDHSAGTENYAMLVGYVTYPLGESNRQRHQYNVKVPRLHNTVLEHVPMLAFAGRNNIGWKPPVPEVGDPVLVLSFGGWRSHNFIIGGMQHNGPIGDLLTDQKVYGIDEIHEILEAFVNQQTIQPNTVAAGFDVAEFAQGITLRPTSPVTSNAVGASVQGSVKASDSMSNDFDVRMGAQVQEYEQNVMENGEGFAINLSDGAPTQNAIKDVHRAVKEQELVQAVFANASTGVWEQTQKRQPHLGVARVNQQFDVPVAREFLRGAQRKLIQAQRIERLQREFVETALVAPYERLLSIWGKLPGLGLDRRGRLSALPTYISPRARYEGIDPATPNFETKIKTIVVNMLHQAGGGNPEKLDGFLTILPLVSEGITAFARGGSQSVGSLNVSLMNPSQLGPASALVNALLGQGVTQATILVNDILALVPAVVASGTSNLYNDLQTEVTNILLSALNRNSAESLATQIVGIIQQSVSTPVTLQNAASVFTNAANAALPQQFGSAGTLLAQVVRAAVGGSPPNPTQITTAVNSFTSLFP